MSQLELWTEQDSVALQYHEQVIEKGLETFYEVGQSLMFIRENRLYRKEFKTFEEYCQEKWGRSRSWANKVINASEVAELLKDGEHVPQNQRQVQPLTKLETPGQQAEAWSNAVANSEDGRPTAKQVDAEVKKLQQKIKQLESEKSTLDRRVAEQTTLITNATQEAEKQAQLVTKANAMLHSEAERIAQQKAEKIKAEFEAKLSALTEAKDKADADYEKALADFKANPDPVTKTKKEQLEREANKAQSELDTTQAELKRLHLQLEDLKTKANHAVSVSITLCAFHKAFKKFMADNTEAIIAMSSPYLDGRQQAEIESLAATLNDWAQKIQDSIDNLRGQTSRAVDVEVIQPIRYFPESEEDEEDDF